MDPRIVKWTLTLVILSILTALTSPLFFSLFSESGFQLRSTEEKTGRVNAPSKHDPKGMGVIPYYYTIIIEEKETKKRKNSKEIRKKETKEKETNPHVTFVTRGPNQEEKNEKNKEKKTKIEKKNKRKEGKKENKRITKIKRERKEREEEAHLFSLFPLREKPFASVFPSAERQNEKTDRAGSFRSRWKFPARRK